MALIIPDSKQLKKLARKKEKLGRPTKPSKKTEMELRRMMGELWHRVLLPATERIMALAKRNAPIYEITREIELALEIANKEYAKVAQGIADKWKAGVNEETRRKLQAGLAQSLGVDTMLILDTPGVKDALALAGMEAAGLIRTIPSECLGKVARAVADNFEGKSLPQGSLERTILHIGKNITPRRATLIARDQTSKLTGALVRTRQEAIGIEEYIWRTSQDQRVAGNPSGLYPDASNNSTFHGNHYEREGKRFRWDTPPPDGHPGHAGFCRCHAQPVIDPKKIAEMARQGQYS